MEFIMKRADVSCLSKIMEVMEEGKQSVKAAEWFSADDETFIRDVLSKNGFIIGAWEKESEEMAGFFSVVFPDKEENLGKYAGLSGEELTKVVYMDSAVVRVKYRGNKLQKQMLEAAEKELAELLKRNGLDCQYRMCTVHPENVYSLQNMVKNGYEIAAKTKLYGGLERYVLCKKVTINQI